METITSWNVRNCGVLINITDLPNLPKNTSDWTCEQHNRFEDLIYFAYDNELNEISWSDERIKDRPCI
jgi:hypothetical protein